MTHHGFITGTATGFTCHTCYFCGCAYDVGFSHLYWLPISAASDPFGHIRANLEKQLWRTGIDQPCPACHRPAARTLGLKRRLWDGLIGFIGVGLVLLVVSLSEEYSVYPGTAESNSVLGFAAMLAGYLIVGYWWGTGAKSTANLSQTNSTPRQTRGIFSRRVDYLCLVLAIGLGCVPALHRNAAHARTNADCYPALVAPGERVRVPLPDIWSIYGAWGGKEPSAEVVNSDSFPGRVVSLTRVETRTLNTSARTSHDPKREDLRKATPWIDFELPAESDLVGRDLDVAVGMIVHFHSLEGVGRRSLDTRMTRTRVTVRVSSPDSVRTFRREHVAVLLLTAGLAAAAAVGIFLTDYRLARLPAPVVEVRDWIPPPARY